VFSSHYILFGHHYKKIFRFGLNSYTLLTQGPSMLRMRFRR
jgi:hypothetical protein